MNELLNPYSPGAGAPPPELVGRETVLEEARILIGRTKLGRSEKSMLLTGLRGVGKTVLLNRIRQMAEDESSYVIWLEAEEGQKLGQQLAPKLRSLLYDLDRAVGAKEKVRSALGSLRSFVKAMKLTYNEIELGVDIEPRVGSADSGNLENDLPDLFQTIAEAALERRTTVIIIIDEIQYFSRAELAALIVALHRMQQRQLPLVLVGAGLPTLPGLVGESKSYAERLFNFPKIGALAKDDAHEALREPSAALDVTFDEAALDEVFRLTKGYPYFLQEWAYVAWNKADTETISLHTVHEATPIVVTRLDEGFFRVRFDRLTIREKEFLRAMTAPGTDMVKTADVAATLNQSLSNISLNRSNLIKKGMIYSPSHGDIAFTVPLFGEFLTRVMPNFGD